MFGRGGPRSPGGGASPGSSAGNEERARGPLGLPSAPPRWAWWALVFLSPVAVALRAFLAGPGLGDTDLDFLFRPFWKYLAASLRDGRLPLWDPYMGAGIPFIAAGQSQALYPPAMLLFAGLPFEVAVYFFSFGHILWTAAGTWRVGRRLGLESDAAISAACFVAAAPVMDALIQHPNSLAAVAWLPWTWLAAERVCEGGRWGIAALAGCVGLGLLCGSPEMTMLGALAVVVLAVVRTAGGNRRAIPLCALGGIAGVGLAAGMMLPFLQLLHHGSHIADIRNLESAWSMGRGDIAGLFLPLVEFSARGPSFQDLFFGPFQGLLCRVYLGIGAVVLAWVAVSGKQRREAWLFGILFLEILLGAQGGWVSVGLEKIHLGQLAWRFPVKYLYSAPIPLALLAAAGADRLSRRRGGRLAPTLLIVGGACVTAELLARRQQLGAPVGLSLAWIGVVFLAIGALAAWAPEGAWRQWALVAAGVADLTALGLRVPFKSETEHCPLVAAIRARANGGRVDGLEGRPLDDTGFYAPRPQQLDCLTGNVLAQYGIPSVHYFGTPWPPGSGALVEHFGPKGDALLGAGLYLRDHPAPQPGLAPIRGLEPLWAASVIDVAPRAELRPKARVVDDVETALAQETVARARAEVLLDSPAPDPTAPGSPYAGPDSAAILRDLGDRVEVETASAEARWLVLADLFDPDWTASVDGVRAPIALAYGTLRAVHLGPGQHLVVFNYRPRAVRVGLGITAATVLALLAGAFVRGRRPRYA